MKPHYGVRWADLSRVVRCQNLEEARDISTKFPPGEIVVRMVSEWEPVL